MKSARRLQQSLAQLEDLIRKLPDDNLNLHRRRRLSVGQSALGPARGCYLISLRNQTYRPSRAVVRSLTV